MSSLSFGWAVAVEDDEGNHHIETRAYRDRAEAERELAESSRALWPFRCYLIEQELRGVDPYEVRMSTVTRSRFGFTWTAWAAELWYLGDAVGPQHLSTVVHRDPHRAWDEACHIALVTHVEFERSTRYTPALHIETDWHRAWIPDSSREMQDF